MQYLSWDFKVSSFSNTELPEVLVTPVIDGVPVYHGKVFDWMALQAFQFHPTRHTPYLFTCDCGEPGCAGIHEPMVIQCNGHTVEWQFNDSESYQFLHRAGWGDGSSPIVWSFDMHQYQQALQELMAQLSQYEAELGLLIHDDYYGTCEVTSTSLETSVAQFKRHYGKRLKELENTARYWGPFNHLSIQTVLSGKEVTWGLRWMISQYCNTENINEKSYLQKLRNYYEQDSNSLIDWFIATFTVDELAHRADHYQVDNDAFEREFKAQWRRGSLAFQLIE